MSQSQANLKEALELHIFREGRCHESKCWQGRIGDMEVSLIQLAKSRVAEAGVPNRVCLILILRPRRATKDCASAEAQFTLTYIQSSTISVLSLGVIIVLPVQ